MGQAKLRGTFEQRQAEAIERNKQEQLKRELERKHRRPMGKSQLGMLMAMAIASTAPNIIDERDFNHD